MLRRRARLIAWSLSVAFHIALAVLLFRDDAGAVRTLPPQAEGLTREAAEDDSAFTFAVAPVSDSSPKPIAIAPPTGRMPVETLRPSPYSPELANLVRDLGTRTPARIEVQDVTPIDFRAPAEVPKASGAPVAPMPLPVVKTSFGKGQPVHGPLPAGKSVVYILDRSTSMGLTRETFDAARAATLGSVVALPEDATFQVIAYGGAAERMLPSRGLLKKSDRLCEALSEALDGLKPEGESRHDRALRAALPLGADVLVFITDAGDDELDALRPILKGHGKPVAVSVVRVQAGRVSAPQAFR